MKALKIFIVEDEPLIVSTIETALKKQGYIVSGDADNFADALQRIKNHLPDLVLIDILLEGEKDGIDLALALDSLEIPYVYLTSQTDPNTITKVKETHPLGYIVKPFTENGLRSNVEVAWNSFLQSAEEYLVFSADNQIHKIRQSQILYLKAFDNYCYIVTATRKYLAPKTLKFFLEQLNPSVFMKPHRSYAININKIESITSDAILLKGISIPLSQSKKESLKKLLK